MLALIPLFPFVGFLVNAFFGRRLPKAVSGGVACLAMVGSFGAALASVWSMRDTMMQFSGVRSNVPSSSPSCPSALAAASSGRTASRPWPLGMARFMAASPE